MTDVPADTDEVIYRRVTKVVFNSESGPVVVTEMTQIRITQP